MTGLREPGSSVASVASGASRGLTVLEILTGIAILGLLLAISVPAIQQARASSIRMQCENNLRQIGLAFHDYSDVYQQIPRSIPVPLLGFVGERPMALHFANNREEAMNVYQRVGVPVYRCPADRTSASLINISYGMNQGAGLARPRVTGGRFLHPKSFNEYADGLSQTALTSEILHSRDDDPLTWDRNFSPALAGVDDAEALRLCRTAAVSTTPLIVNPVGSPWIIQRLSYYHSLAPNTPPCHCELESTPQWWWVRTATSRHAGGVNTLFADGHVTFIGETIDLRQWEAVGTWSGGDRVDAFQ